ncbi:hypothetical protein GPECTOR_15g296 [Gonium pectorale]|uniref:Uncharacterized protein n=1 Tax=Gonium pectorale TaxID=33097 RepID=A0A150GLB3_GONPE|nr:hypothetical protein GPECTOR_15g296 [Gonium pectorale]|eukprot:KXZ50613.1 hypothetical protein GPECTOR_15g296 [Gonium pectorale]
MGEYRMQVPPIRSYPTARRTAAPVQRAAGPARRTAPGRQAKRKTGDTLTDDEDEDSEDDDEDLDSEDEESEQSEDGDEGESDDGKVERQPITAAATAQDVAAQGAVKEGPAAQGAAEQGAPEQGAPEQGPAADAPAVGPLPHIKPDPEPLPAGEARYAQLTGLAFDAAELADLRQHYLEPRIQTASRAPDGGRLRRSTRAEDRISRAQHSYRVLWPHLETLMKQVDLEQLQREAAATAGGGGGRKRKRNGSTPAVEAPATVLLLRALRTLRVHEIGAGTSPRLPLYTLGRLLPGLAEQLRVEAGGVEEATEVVDLTSADDDVIDVETYVVDFIIVREVKAEPGASSAAAGVVVKAEPGADAGGAGGSSVVGIVVKAEPAADDGAGGAATVGKAGPGVVEAAGGGNASAAMAAVVAATEQQQQ